MLCINEKRAQDLTSRSPTKSYSNKILNISSQSIILINSIKLDFPLPFRKKSKCNNENKEKETIFIIEKLAK